MGLGFDHAFSYTKGDYEVINETLKAWKSCKTHATCIFVLFEVLCFPDLLVLFVTVFYFVKWTVSL